MQLDHIMLFTVDLALSVLHLSRTFWLMIALRILCLPITISITTGIHRDPGQPWEYCQWDTFNATCPSRDEVILMESAMYGRMALGQCIERSLGYLGCKVNALYYMDTLCSGRRSCKYEVPDDVLRGRQPCPRGVESHLEASYTCIKVETGGKRLCSSARQANTSSSTSGYLANIITAETSFGSEACPWIIRADAGQRINITLLDFALDEPFVDNKILGDEGRPQKPGHFCHKYAIIKETGTTRETTVCGGEKRERSVYISVSSTVEVYIMRYTTPKKIAYFILKYEAIGCPHLLPPRDGWLEVDGHSVTFGCNTTRRRWSLQCNGKVWIGQMHDCLPDPDSPETMWTVLSDDWSSPFGILIVTAMGVALGLVIGVIMLASVLFCLKRRRSMCSGVWAGRYADNGEDEDDQGNYHPYVKRTATTTLVDQMELTTLNPPDPGYGAMWKARPPSYSVQPAPPLPPTVPDHVIMDSTARSPPDLTTRCDPGVGIKLATVVNGVRATDIKMCNSPKCLKREQQTCALANLSNVPIRQDIIS